MKKVSSVVEVANEADFNRLLPDSSKVVFVAGYKSMEGKELVFGHRKTGTDVKLWLVGYSPQQVVFLGTQIREATQQEREGIADAAEKAKAAKKDVHEAWIIAEEDLFNKRVRDTVANTFQKNLLDTTPVVKRIEFRL